LIYRDDVVMTDVEAADVIVDIIRVQKFRDKFCF